MFRHDARNVNRAYDADAHVVRRSLIRMLVMMRKDPKFMKRARTCQSNFRKIFPLTFSARRRSESRDKVPAEIAPRSGVVARVADAFS